MQENGPVTCSADLDEIEVTLTRKGLATPQVCILRELDGEERDKYMNSQRNKIEREGKSLKDFTDVQSSLIAQCLYDKSTGERIPLAEVRKLPSKTQMTLHKLCIELSGLGDSSEEQAKNA